MISAWTTVPIRDLLIERREVPNPESVSLGEIRIVSKIRFDLGRIELRREAGTKTGMILVRPGDLLISGINAAKGAIAVYGSENTEPVAATIHYGSYSVVEGRANITYLWWYLRSRPFREILFEALPEGIKTELKARRLMSIKIPIPPLSEQLRIVARIEELAAKVQEVRTLRQQTIHGAKALDASLLIGLLPKLAPIIMLCNLVAEDRKISYGVLVPGPNIEDGIPFVRVQDLAFRNPPLAPSKRISRAIDAQYGRTRLRGGEILIGVVGSIGKIGIAPKTWAGANIARAVCRIVPGQSIDRDYLAFVLSAQPAQDYFREATRTLAQPTLNISQLSQTPIPVPSLSEQRHIVAELNELQEKMDSLKRLQVETAVEIDALLPSILDRAFKGEL